MQAGSAKPAQEADVRTAKLDARAPHLVDHVIPRVPVRQWVISFPIPLRTLFAAHPQLLAPVLPISIQTPVRSGPHREAAHRPAT
jgi:hypothetical protein